MDDEQELGDPAEVINRKLGKSGKEPKFLWVVYHESRHIENRFTYIIPHEKIGDLSEEKDPWGHQARVNKIIRYDIAEVVTADKCGPSRD